MRDGEDEATPVVNLSRNTLGFYTVPNIEQMNEEALRSTVRREVFWLFNTIHLAAAVDLSAYPQVRTSVLNFGVPDLTGKDTSRHAVLDRAAQLQAAVAAFEPRIDPRTLSVEADAADSRDNAVTFRIHGDVTSAVDALPVQFLADVELDTGAASVRDRGGGSEPAQGL